MVSVVTSRDANLVTLSTRAEQASLAVQINQRLLELLNEFNLQKRQSRAAAEREFTERRMLEAQQELEHTEGDLRRFLEQNREYQSSPQLRFEAGRLERRVQLRQQVYLSLAQAFEQARIDEVRDTPVITVIERPEFSVRRARSRLVDALVWAVLALAVAIVVALGRDYIWRERAAGVSDYREFLDLRAKLVQSFRGRQTMPTPASSGDPPPQ
jgi:uncharacterized protein involved in exopolysaccharide biosynthesis